MKMKRVISLAMILVMLLSLCLVLASCGEKVECDTCGEAFRAKDKNTSEFLGVTIYTCNDCLEDIEDIKSGLSGLFGEE